jgi:hypothetical protein
MRTSLRWSASWDKSPVTDARELSMRITSLWLLLAGLLCASHNPLLPQPQEVRYGGGELPLKKVYISFGSAPAGEDRFAADELASVLSSQRRMSAASGRVRVPSIVLYRTGAVDAMPGPMFWADVSSRARIFVRYPELFSLLSKDVIAVPWHYHIQPDYSAFPAPSSREKVSQVFAPGIWCWDEITPDFYRTSENVDGFLADGRKYGSSA